MDYHEYSKEQLIRFCEKLQRKMTKYENRLSGKLTQLIVML